jgi:hypothetical protein
LKKKKRGKRKILIKREFKTKSQKERETAQHLKPKRKDKRCALSLSLSPPLDAFETLAIIID